MSWIDLARKALLFPSFLFFPPDPEITLRQEGSRMMEQKGEDKKKGIILLYIFLFVSLSGRNDYDAAAAPGNARAECIDFSSFTTRECPLNERNTQRWKCR